MPPFERIARHIAEQIARGELAPGARLPSERELMSTWEVSKATANKAVAALKAAGLVVTAVGVGARVADHPAAGLGPRDMFARMQRERRIRLPNERSEVTFTGEVLCRDMDAQVVAALGLTADSATWCRRRVIYRDGAPYCVAVSWFSQPLLGQFGSELARRLLDPTPIREGTPAIVGWELGHPPTRGSDWLEATTAPGWLTAELPVAEGAAVLRVVSTVYGDDWPLECGEYYYPAGAGISYDYDLT